MKGIRFDTYKVSISLGDHPSKARWSAVFIGKGFLDGRVKSHLEGLTDRRHAGVWLASGLPISKDCLVLHQCLFLVKSCGLPEPGLSLECVVNGFVIGHIWIDKSIPVIK